MAASRLTSLLTSPSLSSLSAFKPSVSGKLGVSGLGVPTLGPMQRKLLVAFAAGAVGVSAFLFARGVMILIAPQTVWVSPLPTLAPASNAPTVDAEFDPELDIFHRGVQAETAPAALGEDAPETTLNLVLKGLRAGPDGMAIIQTPDRSERNYYIEDAIVSGAVLEAVNPGYAVIRRNGALERLTLDDDESTLTSVAPPPPQAAPRPAALRSAQGVDMMSTGELLQNISLDRAVREGKLVGFEIKARNNASDGTLARAGLREGDIVTAVNGFRVSKGLDLATMMYELQSKPAARLMVLRGDDIVTVRLIGGE